MPLPVFAMGVSTAQDYLSDKYQIDFNGFIEARAGGRIDNTVDEKDASIAETRLQLDFGKNATWGTLKLKGDILGDLVTEELTAELRELNVVSSPFDTVDIKAGRQVLTWGTGDLLFINDLFPKDWESFFIGRDDEYLKAPSDAIKTSLFLDAFNLDLVYVPVFNGSKYIDGSRISYWNSMQSRIAGRDFIFTDQERNHFSRDSEYALRLSKNLNGTELALYFYNGFWNTPEGVDPLAMELIYPRLSVYGASARKAILGGIGNTEIGYYDSRQDPGGDDPLIRNSEIRFLAGYEREIARNFSGGLQYYLEYMEDYAQYESSMPAGARKKDEYRHLITLRLTKLLMNQNLRLSVFTYFSPSDEDAYIRPKANYKLNDNWSIEAGGNLFRGKNDHTFWGQFEDNTNIYAGTRLSF